LKALLVLCCKFTKLPASSYDHMLASQTSTYDNGMAQLVKAIEVSVVIVEVVAVVEVDTLNSLLLSHHLAPSAFVLFNPSYLCSVCLQHLRNPALVLSCLQSPQRH
jgi:hypothetical protein